MANSCHDKKTGRFCSGKGKGKTVTVGGKQMRVKRTETLKPKGNYQDAKKRKRPYDPWKDGDPGPGAYDFGPDYLRVEPARKRKK